MKSRSMKLALAALFAVSLVAGASGCAKKAPQLTAEQLQAGMVPSEHPVNQQQASAQGCACHLQKN